ncbi:MAG: hypothetical protein DRP64_06225 [Verrucomicrobia bacterium]|nr:MAG: hypothetical protein DRP64_06225 [Verrucomicrobiota bacterium]
MRKIAEIISYLALILVVAAPALFYSEKITLQANKQLMLVATIVWFASALLWIGREKEEG